MRLNIYVEISKSTSLETRENQYEAIKVAL